MAGTIDARLAELGIAVPEAPVPVGAYVPFVVTGGLVVISGQLPVSAGEVRYRGTLGADCPLEDGVAAAELCMVNVLAQLRAACDGDLDRVSRCVRLGGFVAATPAFTEHPKVINGAPDLAVRVFGERGRHARFAVGVASLPLGAAVEVEAIFARD